jgi:hypothetical protein
MLGSQKKRENSEQFPGENKKLKFKPNFCKDKEKHVGLFYTDCANKKACISMRNTGLFNKIFLRNLILSFP